MSTPIASLRDVLEREGLEVDDRVRVPIERATYVAMVHARLSDPRRAHTKRPCDDDCTFVEPDLAALARRIVRSGGSVRCDHHLEGHGRVALTAVATFRDVRLRLAEDHRDDRVRIDGVAFTDAGAKDAAACGQEAAARLGLAGLRHARARGAPMRIRGGRPGWEAFKALLDDLAADARDFVGATGEEPGAFTIATRAFAEKVAPFAFASCRNGRDAFVDPRRRSRGLRAAQHAASFLDPSENQRRELAWPGASATLAAAGHAAEAQRQARIAGFLEASGAGADLVAAWRGVAPRHREATP